MPNGANYLGRINIIVTVIDDAGTTYTHHRCSHSDYCNIPGVTLDAICDEISREHNPAQRLFIAANEHFQSKAELKKSVMKAAIQPK